MMRWHSASYDAAHAAHDPQELASCERGPHGASARSRGVTALAVDNPGTRMLASYSDSTVRCADAMTRLLACHLA